eukprot:scaffold16573_cov39-Phaeocystis_antarctica.AAC.2
MLRQLARHQAVAEALAEDSSSRPYPHLTPHPNQALAAALASVAVERPAAAACPAALGALHALGAA